MIYKSPATHTVDDLQMSHPIRFIIGEVKRKKHVKTYPLMPTIDVISRSTLLWFESNRHLRGSIITVTVAILHSTMSFVRLRMWVSVRLHAGIKRCMYMI